MDSMSFGLLVMAALFAGFIDAVAGGGGLIQVPALFAALPGELPARVFGTNKLASVFGTGSAAYRFARRIGVPWRIALPAAIAAFGSSFLGAAVVDWLPKAIVRPVVLVLLSAVIVYTLARREFGEVEGVRLEPILERGLALLVGATLGFYDGFFGPGTGSFLLFAFVRVFRLDFLRASSASKVVNFGTNAAALTYFVPTGNVLWVVGGAMAVANVVGASLGARSAIMHGSGFVKRVFVLAAGLLVCRFAWDTFGG